MKLIYDYTLLIHTGIQIKLASEKLNEIQLLFGTETQDNDFSPFFNSLKVRKNKQKSHFNNVLNHNEISFNKKTYINNFMNHSKIKKIWKYVKK